MNMKEFNEKKQDIIDVLNEVNAGQEPMQYGQYSWLFDKVNELQPPKPPTCSTCKYKENSYHLLSEGRKKLGGYYCKNKKIKTLTTDCFGDDDCMELPLRGFGCNRHSDYEVKDETN